MSSSVHLCASCPLHREGEGGRDRKLREDPPFGKIMHTVGNCRIVRAQNHHLAIAGKNFFTNTHTQTGIQHKQITGFHGQHARASSRNVSCASLCFTDMQQYDFPRRHPGQSFYFGQICTSHFSERKSQISKACKI